MRAGRIVVNKAEITVTGLEESIRAVEESADAANLLAMELTIGGFEAGQACTDRLVQAAEHAVRATARMARLMGPAGTF